MTYGIGISDLFQMELNTSCYRDFPLFFVFCLLSYFHRLGEALVANPFRILPRQRAINPIDTIKDKSFPLRSPDALG